MVYGSTARPMMTSGLLQEFHPHRLGEMRDTCAKPCDQLWKKVLASAQQYLEKAQDAAAAAESAGLQADVTATVKALAETARKLLVDNPDEYRQANWA